MLEWWGQTDHTRMSRHFNELLKAKWNEGKFLCVGLDPDIDKIPDAFKKGTIGETLLAFNTYILEETRESVCAYKPNSAFYEQYGAEGIEALKHTLERARGLAPDVPIILDAKRADIGNTNNGYVTFAFDYLGADAVTVHPYMGGESLEPFLSRSDKGIFVLCRTSNNGASEFQDAESGGKPLYLSVAESVARKWNANGNCGLVAGATFPEEMQIIRDAAPDLPLLIPGVGAQGGDLEASVHYGKNTEGKGMIIAIARAIIFSDSPRTRAQEFHSAIQKEL